MAFAIVQGVFIDDAIASGTTLALTLTGVTVGNRLRAAVYCDPTQCTIVGVSSTAGDSGAFSIIGSIVTDPGIGSVAQFYKDVVSTSSGSVTITFTVNTAAIYKALYVEEISGVTGAPQAGSTIVLQQNPGTGANAVTTGNITPSAQPAVMCALSMDMTATNPPVSGTGFTSIASGWHYGLGSNSTNAEYKAIASTSPTPATWTANAGGGTDRYANIVAIFTETGAAAPSPPVIGGGAQQTLLGTWRRPDFSTAAHARSRAVPSETPAASPGVSPPVVYGARPASLYRSYGRVPYQVGSQIFPGWVSVGDCSGSAAMSSFAAAAAGLVTFTGAVAAAMASFAASAAALETFPSSGSAAMQRFAATASGAEAFVCSGSAAASPFAATAAGAESFPCSGSAAMSPFAATAAGSEAFSSTAGAAMQPFGSSGNGASGSVFTSTAGAAMSSFGASASGAETFSASASAACSQFAVTGACAEAFTSTASAACSPFGSSGNGAIGTVFTCTASSAVSSFGASASGAEAFSGTAGAALAPIGASGTGAETFSGSGAAAASTFGASGNAASGTSFTSSASAAMAGFACSSAGTETFSGSGTAACSPFAVTAVASETFSCTGGAALQTIGAAGNAASGTSFTCTAAAALSSFGVGASGAEAFSSSGTAACAPFGVSGLSGGSITSSATAACSRFGASGAAEMDDGSIICNGSVAMSPFGAAGAVYEEFTATVTAAMRSFAVFAISPSGSRPREPLEIRGPTRFKMRVGDLAPYIGVQATDLNGYPAKLEGVISARFRMRLRGLDEWIVDATATADESGALVYRWLAGDTDVAPGIYHGEFVLVTTDGPMTLPSKLGISIVIT